MNILNNNPLVDSVATIYEYVQPFSCYFDIGEERLSSKEIDILLFASQSPNDGTIYLDEIWDDTVNLLINMIIHCLCVQGFFLVHPSLTKGIQKYRLTSRGAVFVEEYYDYLNVFSANISLERYLFYDCED